MHDLENDLLSLDNHVTSVEEAWEEYKTRSEVIEDGVIFDQFKARLKDHRKQVMSRQDSSLRDEVAFANDRHFYPRQARNHRGELVFDMTIAKELLRSDVKAGKHEAMTPTELFLSRPEYQLFNKNKFKHRIYQEIRYQKYLNYLRWKQEQTK